MKSGHSVLACWTGILSRDTLGVQNARTACPDMLSPLIGLPKCPYFPAICMSFQCVRSEYPHKKDIRFVRTVCLSTMADQNMHSRFSGQNILPYQTLEKDSHVFHSKWTLTMSMQTIYGCLSPSERLGMLRWGATALDLQRYLPFLREERWLGKGAYGENGPSGLFFW